MNKINSKHFMIFMIITLMLSISIYPFFILKSAGNDILIVVFISCILVFLYVFYLLWICKKTNTYDITIIFKKSLGSFLGNFFLIIYLIGMLAICIESASIEANTIHITSLVSTPTYYLLIFFIGVTYYCVKKDLKPINILSVIVTSIILINVIILTLGTIPDIKIKYLLPVLPRGFDKKFFTSILLSIGYLSFFTVLFPYVEQISDKENILKASSKAILIICIFLIVTLGRIVMDFTAKYASTLWYVPLVEAQLVNIFDIFESGELFLYFKIIGGFFIKYVLSFYSMVLVLKKLNLLKKYTIEILTLIIYIISTILSSDTLVLFKVLNIFLYSIIVILIVIPVIIFTIYLLKFNYKEKHQNTSSENYAQGNFENNNNSQENAHNNKADNNSKDQTSSKNKKEENFIDLNEIFKTDEKNKNN